MSFRTPSAQVAEQDARDDSRHNEVLVIVKAIENTRIRIMETAIEEKEIMTIEIQIYDLIVKIMIAAENRKITTAVESKESVNSTTTTREELRIMTMRMAK